MSKEIKQVKIGGLTYHENHQGFWISLEAKDPMSATITKSELLTLVNEYRNLLQLGLDKAVKKMEELNNFMEYHS